MIGIDLVETKDFQKAVDEYGDGFLNKIFTRHELNRHMPLKKGNIKKLAGCFAAKEAVVKALGLKDFKWSDIEIIDDGSRARILTAGAEKVFTDSNLSISISLARDNAIAAAFALNTGAS